MSGHRSSRCWLERDKFGIIADRMFREAIDDDQSSIEHLAAIMYHYYHKTNHSEMRFSTTFKSKYGWRLSDGNKLAKRIRVKNDHYSFMKWILADTDPITEGCHCWRVQINNPRKGWMSVGVAEMNAEELNNRPFGGPTVWAIGLSNTWYQTVPCIDWTDGFRLKFVELDIMMNLKSDESELRICAVDDAEERRETVLRNKQKTVIRPVPYFNAYYNGAIQLEFRAVFINPEMYGIPIPNLFDR